MRQKTEKPYLRHGAIRALAKLANGKTHFGSARPKAMTLQEAKSIARHLGLTLRQVRSGAYRVNFRDGNEMTAYYTDNLEDAVKTAVEMARTRDVTHAVDEAVAVEIRRRPGRK